MPNKKNNNHHQSNRIDRIQSVLDFCSAIIREDSGLSEQTMIQDSQLPDVIMPSDHIQPVSESEMNRAVDLLETILTNPSPAKVVSDHLDEIEGLLPAFLELNIRDVQRKGNQDVLIQLRALQTSLKLKEKEDQLASPALRIPSNSDQPESDFNQPVVLFASPPTSVGNSRGEIIRQSLLTAGCSVHDLHSVSIEKIQNYDVFIACNPHSDPMVMKVLATCAARHIPVLIDLDNYYEDIPLSDPSYPQLSLHSPEAARAYTSALVLASAVSVPSRMMADALLKKVKNVWVVPDGWSNQNILWNHPIPKHNMVNIGWGDSTGRVEDILPIRRLLIRTIREFSQTQLVIYGNSQVYQLFDSLPETRKLFVPETAPDDYPYLLDQIDILTVPLLNNPFNQYKSDKPLMEAGVKYTPWIASPIPAYLDWEKGGLIAKSIDEWHTYLRQLIIDTDLRISLGVAGNKKSNEREVSQLSIYWLEIIQEVMKIHEKTVSM